MRTKTPPTNIYFSIKRHALGAKGGGSENIYRYQFCCIIKAYQVDKRKVGEKNHQHHGPNKCVQQHHLHQYLLILVCLQQYHLRLPSSVQQSLASTREDTYNKNKNSSCTPSIFLCLTSDLVSEHSNLGRIRQEGDNENNRR